MSLFVLTLCSPSCDPGFTMENTMKTTTEAKMTNGLWHDWLDARDAEIIAHRKLMDARSVEVLAQSAYDASTLTSLTGDRQLFLKLVAARAAMTAAQEAYDLAADARRLARVAYDASVDAE